MLFRSGSLDGSDHLIQGARWGAEGECRALGRGAGGAGARLGARAHLRWVPCLHGQLLCRLPGGSGWGWGNAQDRTPGQPKDTGNSDLPVLGTGGGILRGKEGEEALPVPDDGPGGIETGPRSMGGASQEPCAACMPGSAASPRDLGARGKGALVTGPAQRTSVWWQAGGLAPKRGEGPGVLTGLYRTPSARGAGL